MFLLAVIRLIGVVLAIIALSKSYLDYRKKRESFAMFAIWAIAWISTTVIVLYPTIIDYVATYTRSNTVSSGSLTSLAFVLLLYIVYRVYAKAARIEYQQNELIRKVGLSRKFGEQKDS